MCRSWNFLTGCRGMYLCLREEPRSGGLSSLSWCCCSFVGRWGVYGPCISPLGFVEGRYLSLVSTFGHLAYPFCRLFSSMPLLISIGFPQARSLVFELTSWFAERLACL